MPDKDIIDRKVPRGWRASVKLFTGPASEREVAKAVAQALARSLRENEGIPAASRWIELLRDRISGKLDPHHSFTRVDVIEQQLRHTRHAKVAARAVRSMLVDIDRILLHDPHFERSLMEEFLWELTDHSFFGRLRPEIVGQERFQRIADVDRREHRCRHALEPALKKLATRLADNPDAEGLRTPHIQTGAPKNTGAILDQPLM